MTWTRWRGGGFTTELGSSCLETEKIHTNVVFLPSPLHSPTREFSETPWPRRMSRPLTTRPTLGVGGRDWSMKGRESSSNIGDLPRASSSSSALSGASRRARARRTQQQTSGTQTSSSRRPRPAAAMMTSVWEERPVATPATRAGAGGRHTSWVQARISPWSQLDPVTCTQHHV